MEGIKAAEHSIELKKLANGMLKFNSFKRPITAGSFILDCFRNNSRLNKDW